MVIETILISITYWKDLQLNKIVIIINWLLITIRGIVGLAIME